MGGQGRALFPMYVYYCKQPDVICKLSVTWIGSSCLRLWAAALQPAEQGRIPDVLRDSTKLAQRAILWIGFLFSACISRAEC